MLAACRPGPSDLEQVRAIGELRVATMNGPTTYYFGAEGPTGFEYELVRGFAGTLGVSLRLVVPPTFDRLLPLVRARKVHFAAAGITVTPARLHQARFGPSYQIVTQQVVCRRGERLPRDTGELAGRDLHVVAGSSYVERLEALRGEHPRLAWIERDDAGAEDLAALVDERRIDCTVLDSNLFDQLRRLYPELVVAFDLSMPQALAWAFPHAGDGSLRAAAADFISGLERSGELAALRDRYYGPAFAFDYVEASRLHRHARERLPQFEALLRAAADRHALDWRLLAALAYQESHWRADARSPTGVRGLMMLTRRTAARVGIDDRLDPAQSIAGGARYLAELRTRLPARIEEPDRTWFALAAYNVGLGHLEDARVLAARAGADADSWAAVREFLPRLTRRQWYSRTRYGYARGTETVRFVRNVRRYHDVMQKLYPAERPPEPAGEPPYSPVL